MFDASVCPYPTASLLAAGHVLNIVAHGGLRVKHEAGVAGHVDRHPGVTAVVEGTVLRVHEEAVLAGAEEVERRTLGTRLLGWQQGPHCGTGSDGRDSRATWQNGAASTTLGLLLIIVQ